MALSDLDVLDTILDNIPEHDSEGKELTSLSRIRDIISTKMGTGVIYADSKSMEKFLIGKDFDWSYGMVSGGDGMEVSLVYNFLSGLSDDLEGLDNIMASSKRVSLGLSDIYSYLEDILSEYREIRYEDDIFEEVEARARHNLFLAKVKDYLSSTGEFFNVIDRLKLRRYYRITLLTVKDILNANLPFDDVPAWLASKIEIPITEDMVETLIESLYSDSEHKEEFTNSHVRVKAEHKNGDDKLVTLESRIRIRKRTLFSDMKTLYNIPPTYPGYLTTNIAVITGYTIPFYVVRREDAGSVTYSVHHRPVDVYGTGVFLEYANARPDLRTGKKSDKTMARIHFKKWNESKDRTEFSYLICSPRTVTGENVLNLYPNYQSIERVRFNLPKALYAKVYNKNLEFTEDKTEPSKTIQEAKTKRIDVRHLRPLIWSKVYKDASSGPCLGCNTILYKEDFHIAHIHAHAEGGKECYDNLLPLCSGCNVSCSKKHLYQFLLEKNPTVAKHHFLTEPDFQRYLRYHVNIASALSYLEVMSLLKILPERLPHWRAELTKRSVDYEHRNIIAITVIKEYSQRL